MKPSCTTGTSIVNGSIGDRDLDGGMTLNQCSRQSSVAGPEFEDFGIGHVGDLTERDARERVVVAEEPSEVVERADTVRVRSSTSSRSRYSGRSVCNHRSSHDASGRPRGMLSMSKICMAM
jgi:hypothetical protein